VFLLFSGLAICPGFYFRQHYFILVLPAIALFAGIAISDFSDLLRNRLIAVRLIPLMLFAVALILPIIWEKTFFFSLSPVEASREIYSESPFPESIRIA